MSKKIHTRLPNVPPKLLTTVLLTLSLTSCEETFDHQLAYLTAAEREDYETYGFLPDNVEKTTPGKNILEFIAFATLGGGAIGWAMLQNDLTKSKKNSKNR